MTLLRLNLPDDLRRSIVQAAEALGQTPEEWAIKTLREHLTQRDPMVRRHFGAVNLGKATGTDNAQIDADLAQTYADSHKRD